MTSELAPKGEELDVEKHIFDSYKLRVSNFNVHSVHDRKTWDQEPEYHLLSPFDLELVLNARRVNVLSLPNIMYVDKGSMRKGAV
jgi:hypothetical protein